MKGENSDEDYYVKPRTGISRYCKIKQQDIKPDRLNGEYVYHNEIKRRVIGPTCMECKLKCDQRIAERFRQNNYNKFWGKLKSWDERRCFLRGMVQVLRLPLKNKTRKKFLRKYYLETEDGYTNVCKTMFFNTFAISTKFMDTTILKYPSNTLDESKIKYLYNPKRLKECNADNELKVSANKNTNRNVESDRNIVNKYDSNEEILLSSCYKNDMKPPCSCSEVCGIKIPEEMRLKIYEHFWVELTHSADRKFFILNTIRKDRNTSIKTFVLPIKDGHVTVCQEMYLNTLALNEKSIEFALPNETQTQLAPSFPSSSTSTSSSSSFDKNDIKKYIQEYDKHLQILSSMKTNILNYKPLKPPCSCRIQCRMKMTEYIRQQIHKEFWSLPAQVDQKHFILSTIKTNIYRDKKTKEKITEVKHYTLPLYYQNVLVCKEMYLNTLAISEDFVMNTINNVNNDGSIAEDHILNIVPEKELISVTKERPEIPPPKKLHPNILKKVDPEDHDFINCTVLLESEINEDVLHSEKDEVKKAKKGRLSRKMGVPCHPSCRHQCSKKIAEPQRIKLHHDFWYSMNWPERKQFITNTVKEFPIKTRSAVVTTRHRNFSRKYSLPVGENKISVCQKMYFNTLSICNKFIAKAHLWASQVKW